MNAPLYQDKQLIGEIQAISNKYPDSTLPMSACMQIVFSDIQAGDSIPDALDSLRERLSEVRDPAKPE